MFLFSLIIEEIRLYIYKFYFKNKLEKSLRNYIQIIILSDSDSCLMSNPAHYLSLYS